MDGDPADRSGQPLTGTKRALLIGVDGYAAVNPLQGCVNDILAIRSFLVDKGGWQAQNIQVLAAPPRGAGLPADVGAASAPSRQNILAALQTLGSQVQAHDQVVFYYSGHGVRIGRGPDTLLPNADAPNYHISAICPVDAQLSGLNLVLNRELNAGLNRLLAQGATVTAVFDSCHSGGVATRAVEPGAVAAGGPAVREIVLDPAQIDWAAVRQQYALDGEASAVDQRAIAPDNSGWVPTIAQAAELIVVSGCRDVEVSHEYTPAGQRHGALTYFLLDALQQANPAQVTTLRWLDLYPRIRANVNSQFPDQMPTLEGRAERPVFGGGWTPFAPGFSVTVGAGGRLQLNGGTIHGLGAEAQVAIYPPGTTSFAQADRDQVPHVLARIVRADAVSSEAQVLGGGGAVANGARALLVRPSAGRPPLPVRLTQVPDAIRTAIEAASGVSTLVNLSPGTAAPAVEVRPWTRDSQAGWAIVRAKTPSAINPVGENDVIGFLPAAGGMDDGDVGTRLGLGITQWARYRSVLDRRNDEPALANMIRVEVLASTDLGALRRAPLSAAAPVRPPSAAGVVAVTVDESLLLRFAVDPRCPTDLNVGIVLASDEGNIAFYYDTGLNPVPPGEQRPAGLNGPFNTFKVPVSAWQTASGWTFKLIATDAAHPFDVRSLTLDTTVQDLLTGGVRGLPVADTLPTVQWTTVEVPVVVSGA